MNRLATNSILTFPEFKAKHKLKYSGLGNAQIRQRYDNYLSSSEPSRPTALVPSGRVRQKNPFGGSAISMSQTRDPTWLAQHGMVAPGVQLSAPSTQYIGALTDPSNPAFIGAGYPQASQGPSLKSRFFVRTTLTVGTSGTGFAAFSPLSGIVNNLDAVAVSTAAYTGVGAFPASFSGTGVALHKTNSTLASIKGVAGRVVAASVKISPVGKLIDEAGLITTVVAPGGVGLNAVTAAAAQTEWWRYVQVHEQPREGNRKFSALWTPTFPNLPFFNDANSNGILDRARANAGSGLVELVDVAGMAVNNIGVIVEGATPGFAYYVEAYVHAEFFAGALFAADAEEDNVVTQHATPTYSDAAVMDLVNSSTGTALNALPKTDDGSSASTSVTEWLGSAAKGVSYFANAMQSLGSLAGGSEGASSLMSSVGSSVPALDSSASLASMGGFLEAAPTVASDTGPLVEMITEAGEFLPLLAL